MDKKNYTIKTKLHSHNPKVVEKLIGGGGVLNMLNDVLGNLPKMGTPFDVLGNDDFDHSDPIVEKFMDMGGPKHVIKIFKINSPGLSIYCKSEDLTGHLLKFLLILVIFFAFFRSDDPCFSLLLYTHSMKVWPK